VLRASRRTMPTWHCSRLSHQIAMIPHAPLPLQLLIRHTRCGATVRAHKQSLLAQASSLQTHHRRHHHHQQHQQHRRQSRAHSATWWSSSRALKTLALVWQSTRLWTRPRVPLKVTLRAAQSLLTSRTSNSRLCLTSSSPCSTSIQTMDHSWRGTCMYLHSHPAMPVIRPYIPQFTHWCLRSRAIHTLLGHSA
jgi:hypothetical protein